MEITGEIITIIYKNEVNSYSVAEIETDEEVTTIVGFLPFVNLGDTLKLIGKYVEHKEYGRQFKVDTFEKIIPQNLSALERYLSNGNIKGIGEALAKKIVNILLIPNGVINTIVYPRIVQTKNKIFVRRVLWLRIGVALLIYGGLLCFASFIVKVLGGVEMLAAVPVVNVLGGLIIITALEYYLGGTVLVAFNHGKEFNLSVIYALFVYLLMVSGLIACNVVTLYSIIIVALLNELFTTLYRWYYCRKYKLL